MSDTPGIADQLAATIPAPGSMSGALAEYANIAHTRRDLARDDQRLINLYEFGH